MKRLLLFSLILALGASVALWSPATVRAGPPPFPGNGDVNDDGSRDLSDAIYLLAHLFQGGSAPAVCPNIEPPADPEVLLPATNQTVCYETTFDGVFPPELLPVPDCDVFNCDVLSPPSCTADLPDCWDNLGITDQRYCFQCLASLIPDPDEGVAPDGTVEITCPTAPATGAGQDGFFQNGCPTAGRFVDNTDGTVTDNCTGLMWTQDIVDASGDGTRDHDDNVNWCAALNACEDLDFANQTDWRLPNITELESIVDYGRIPTINSVFADFVIDPGDPGDPGGVPPIPVIPPSETGFVFWSSTSYDANRNSGFQLARTIYFRDSDLAPPNPFMIPNYGGLSLACSKSDDHCISFDERFDKIYVRAVRTVPLPAGASGQGAATLGNGDVNGDNSLDLSDAIYLLAFLFQGGPPPVDCPESGGGGGPFLDVNNIGRLTSTLTTHFLRTECYEETTPDDWGHARCDDPGALACPGQDAFYEREGSHSCQGNDRFVDNGDATATDNCTGLMWHKGRTWPTPELGGRLTWLDALAFVDTLVLTSNGVFKDETDTLDPGESVLYSDWRMPNIREMDSVRDYNLIGQNLAGPLQARRARYYSSTTVPSKPSHVYGYISSRITMPKNSVHYHVRPVRTVTVTP